MAVQLDLTEYVDQPLEMTFGAWTIASPVPDARTGKIIAATFEAARAAAEALEDDTIEDGAKIAEQINASLEPLGITDENSIDRLVLGGDQVDKLLEDGCPPSYIRQAGQFAYLRWALDSLPAAQGWIKGQADANNPKPRNRAERRKKG